MVSTRHLDGISVYHLFCMSGFSPSESSCGFELLKQN